VSEKEIAVISTTFNRAKQLYRSIWSIAHQDYPLDKFVLFIIDDGSIDDTQKYIDMAFKDFPDLNMVDILTDRKPRGHFGGQGIAYNIGLRHAEEMGVEYVFLTGGDILWPSYAMRKHLEVHNDPRKIACALQDQKSTMGEYVFLFDEVPEPHMPNLAEITPDVMIGPRQYFIRPDKESIGNDYEVLASIPDRYDWKPPEKLLAQPVALTLEEFPGGSHIYIGYTGDKPCDTHHWTWPTLQSCKLEHWLNIGGWNEHGEGHFWEDLDLDYRFIKYAKWRKELGLKNIVPIVHPSTECFHQPHQRQLSQDNRAVFVEDNEKYGFNVNIECGIDWGRSKHSVVRSRIT
jgi:glycosyltransferase involved in cell wall biosynthesis